MASPETLVISGLMAASAGVASWFSRDWVGFLLARIENNVNEELRAMRVSTPHLRKYLAGWMYLMVVTLVLLWFGYGSLVFGVLAVVLMGPLPWYLLKRMAQRRRDKIEEQLAGSMTTLSGAIRAGLSLAQALEILAEQSPRPIKLEFQHMVGQYSMGKTLQETLMEAKERLKSENFSMFAAAMLASRESGGKLNETVERIAESVREFQRLERKIQAETAQAKKSAVYMALAPPIILFVYYFVDPVNTTRLFTTLPGQIMLSVSIILDVVAWLWAAAILTPDI
ncbi:MAG: type II secretion system F family protein [Mariniblastus sp.]|nr:type II secretion system F family protein [Mariniblastus sp.]